MSLGWAARRPANAPPPAGACTRWRWSSVPEAGSSGVAERPAAGPHHRGPPFPCVRLRDPRGQYPCPRWAEARGWWFDSRPHAPSEPRSPDQSHPPRPPHPPPPPPPPPTPSPPPPLPPPPPPPPSSPPPPTL